MKKLLIPFLFLIVLGGCEKSADSNATFNGGTTGTGGSLARFTIAGNYLYTVDKENLNVFDISSPGTPVFKRTVPVGFQIETIYPFKDKLFIGSTSVVHIFSIADPSSPQKLAEAISPNVLRRCDPVVAKDTVAYATLRTDGPCGGTQSILAAYDIKDVTKPIQRGFASVNSPYGLGYADSALYVCSQTEGLVVFNIASAYNPLRVRVLRPDASQFIDVIPYGNLLVCWLNDGMSIYDISTRLNPVFIKKII